MLERNELRELYNTKTQEVIRFEDIRLLAKAWPRHLAKWSPFELHDGHSYAIPIRTGLYETEGRIADVPDVEEEGVVFHSYMVVLRDNSGVTLLDCYDGFPVWEGAVANGWMGSEWKMWTIQVDGELALIDKMQLAFYICLQRMKAYGVVTDAEDTDRYLLEVIKAIQFMIGALQQRRYTTEGLRFLSGPEKAALGRITASCEFDFVEDTDRLGRTAVAFSRNEEFTRFLEEYRKGIEQACRDFSEQSNYTLGSSLDGLNVEFLDLTSVYWKKWWYHESLPVQLLLLFVAMKLTAKGGDVYLWERRWRKVRRQVMQVIYQYAELPRFVCEGESRRSMYSVMVHYCGNDGEEVVEGGVMQSGAMEETLIYHLGTKVAENILNAVYPLYCQDVGDSLDGTTFAMMRSSCLDETLTLLTENGFIRSRDMMKIAEVGETKKSKTP